jgi:hypothetical protein
MVLLVFRCWLWICDNWDICNSWDIYSSTLFLLLLEGGLRGPRRRVGVVSNLACCISVCFYPLSVVGGRLSDVGFDLRLYTVSGNCLLLFVGCRVLTVQCTLSGVAVSGCCWFLVVECRLSGVECLCQLSLSFSTVCAHLWVNILSWVLNGIRSYWLLECGQSMGPCIYPFSPCEKILWLDTKWQVSYTGRRMWALFVKKGEQDSSS